MENIVDAPCPWPWIVFVNGENLENLMFCDGVSDPKITTGVTRSIPKSITKWSVLEPTNINGWFLLQPHAGRLCLWNVVTLKSINIPPLEMLKSEYIIDFVFLTKSPDDYNCMILLFMKKPRDIHYCYANEDTDWTLMDNLEEVMELEGGYKCCVAIGDDKIIMTCNTGVVAKIEIVKPKSIVISPYPDFPEIDPHVLVPSNPTPTYWIPCCGHLFVIHVTYGGNSGLHIVSIDIFKLDFSDMSVKVVDNCPNTSFFIRRIFKKDMLCHALPIASDDSYKAGNRVYIVEGDEDHKNDEEGRLLLHTYHIQRKTLKTCLISTSKNESEPYWMMVSDAQALTKAEEDCRSGEDDENDQLFVKRENTKMMMTHKNCEEEEKKYSIVLEDLPIDILKTIASHLTDISDYLNFRVTSKFFRDNFSKKEWRDMRASESDSIQTLWLIYPKSHQIGKSVFSMVDLITRNKYDVRVPEILEENWRICYSANGWLLMSSPTTIFEDNDMFEGLKLLFYNPITTSTICLPELPSSYVSHFIFCNSPDYQELCIVIGISRYVWYGAYSVLYINYKDPGEDEWGEWVPFELTIQHEDEMCLIEQSNVNAVQVGDVYYFLVGDGNIAYISYGENNTLGIHYLEEPCNKSSYEKYFLAAFDEDLVSIYVGKEWKWLKAFKFNESDMVWDKVINLGDNNIYLSYVSSTVSEAQSPEVGNRIYFSRFYQGSIVYYSFNTQQFHINDGKDSVMSDYYGSDEQLYSCWMKPRWKS